MKSIKLVYILCVLASGLLASPAHALSNTDIKHALNKVKPLNPFDISASEFVDKGTYSEATVTLNNKKVTFIAYKPKGSKIANIAFTTKAIKFTDLIPSIEKSFIHRLIPSVELRNVTTILIPPKLKNEKEGETKIEDLPQPIKYMINAAYKGVEVINLPTGMFSIYQLKKRNNSSFLSKVLTSLPLGLNNTVTSFISIDAGNYSNLTNVEIAMSVVLKRDNPINKLVNGTQILKSPKNGDLPVLTLSGSASGATVGINYEAPYTAFGKKRVYETEMEFTVDADSGAYGGALTIGIDGELKDPVIVPDIGVDGAKLKGIQLKGLKMSGVEVSMQLASEEGLFTITPGFSADDMVVRNEEKNKGKTTYTGVEVQLAITDGVPVGAVMKVSSKDTVDLVDIYLLMKIAHNAMPGGLTLSNSKGDSFQTLLSHLKGLPPTGIKGSFTLVTPGMNDSNHLSDFVSLAGAGVLAKGDLILLSEKVAHTHLSLDIVNGLKIHSELDFPELRLGGKDRIKLEESKIDVEVNFKHPPKFKVTGKLDYDGSLNPGSSPIVLAAAEFKFNSKGLTLITDMGCIPPFLKINLHTDKYFAPKLDTFPITVGDCGEKIAKKVVKGTKDLGTGIGQELGINSDGKNTYSVQIDCYDSDVDDTGTKNKISVSYWKDDNLLDKHGIKNPDCGVLADETYKFTTHELVTHISIKTNGKDAFWMDRIYFKKHGDTRHTYGQNGHGGWCLSTDPKDGKSWKDRGKIKACYESLVFNYYYSKKVYAENKPPPRPPVKVDAAINWGNGKAYFFGKNKLYSRFNTNTNKQDPDYPKMTVSHWKGYDSSIVNAAVSLGNGKAYFFNNAYEYVRYDIKKHKADPGYPKLTGVEWGIISPISAAVNRGNGKVYFFSGKVYYRYDIKKKKVDSGYPKLISKEWKIPFKTIDAAYDNGDGKMHFFSGKKYVSVDIKTLTMDAGYPKNTSSYSKALD